MKMKQNTFDWTEIEPSKINLLFFWNLIIFIKALPVSIFVYTSINKNIILSINIVIEKENLEGENQTQSIWWLQGLRNNPNKMDKIKEQKFKKY